MSKYATFSNEELKIARKQRLRSKETELIKAGVLEPNVKVDNNPLLEILDKVQEILLLPLTDFGVSYGMLTYKDKEER